MRTSPSEPVLAPGEDDRDLVRLMAAGDESALGTLHDRWLPLVYSLVFRIVGDRDDAEEVVEDAFWQAWRQADRYHPSRGAVSTWLTMIARSRALDHVRARKRMREDSWEDVAEAQQAVSDAPGGLQDAENEEVSGIVRAALAELPAEQRIALELAYFGGMSQSEIATETGEALGTVKTRVRLALRKLREKLAVLQETTT